MSARVDAPAGLFIFVLGFFAAVSVALAIGGFGGATRWREDDSPSAFADASLKRWQRRRASRPRAEAETSARSPRPSPSLSAHRTILPPTARSTTRELLLPYEAG